MRVAEADGGVACLIQVWAAGTALPTAAGERRSNPPARRDWCRQDILEAIRKAGRPLTRKQFVRGLREAKKGHGPGTVAKALADRKAAGELVNPKDKRGYRLAVWTRRSHIPILFDRGGGARADQVADLLGVHAVVPLPSGCGTSSRSRSCC